MLLIYKSNKGSSIPMVFLIASVLIILSVALGDSVLQSFRINREQETVEYTYLAGEAAIERCFGILEEVITKPSYIEGITWSSNEEFATEIVNKINSSGLFSAGYAIDVLDNASNKAEVKLEISRAGVSDTTVTDGGTKLRFPIAVKAFSTLNNGMFSSYSRTIYAKRDFTVHLPSSFQINAAIYSIGDVMAEGGINARITGGDVYAYGTAPNKKVTTHQDFYGGIYASDNSKINIERNAFTRAFIRAGKLYSNSGSEVRIGNDAIAQSIQIFGNNSRIYIGNNALTIDDLEVDGANSVLAVNGSYIGLSKDGRSRADALSAIVNAAPIYHSYSEDSQKSRIVVNGDVVIGGATYKVDPDDFTAIYQMEDASFAWYTDTFENAPAYKVLDSDDYLQRLRDNRNYTKGYLNLFQIFPRTTDADTLFSMINSVRGIGSNNFSGYTVPEKINGFANNAMSANDKEGLYFMGTDGFANSDINKIQVLNQSGNFNMSYVEGFDTYNTFWNQAAAATDINDYTTKINDLLSELRKKVLGHITIFADRDFPNINESSDIESNTIENSFTPSGKEIAGFTAYSQFDYIKLCLQYNVPESNLNVIKIYDTSEISTVDACGLQAERYATRVENEEDEYDLFLLINLDPDRDVVVDGSFKGIIFSMGRVILENGAYVEGAIVAAGKGYDSVLGVSGSSAEYENEATGQTRLPVIDEDSTNITDLDDGTFAGVLFRGSGSATVHFPGRTTLIEKFAEEGIYLNTIF